MASRPRDHRGSRTAPCNSTRRNGWQLRLSTLGPPETEADHHNYTADDAGEQSVRRPRDGLNTVRPRASRCGRCVLTPSRTRRCAKPPCQVPIAGLLVCASGSALSVR
jgi:hypothetical protein